MTIAAWLQRHLEATGAWDSDGIHRRAHATTCRSCRAWILTGLDDDTCAFAVTVDPDPVDALGETLALLAGRRTYNLTNDRGRLVLDHRNRWTIAGKRKWPVVAEHACNSLPLPADNDPPGYAVTAPARYPDNPPF